MTELLTSDRNNIWHPFTPLVDGVEPVLITSGKGVYLHTHDGRKIIDAISSWWVNLHGHSNEKIAKAIADQALKLEHVIFAGFTHEPAIRLSEKILSILPTSFSKIFFSDDGSTSVEVALKLAIQYWHNTNRSRPGIIAIDGAYHGDTFGSMSVGERSLFTKPFEQHLFETHFIDFPTSQNEEFVLNQFSSIVEKGNIAAFIFEPLIQGASGMRMYPASILDKMIRFAQDHGVICIADEVFTGFGRTGKLTASDYLHYKPDIITLSKGITGGTLPLGVTACSEKIVNAFKTGDFNKTFFHGHSYTANPLACAAANASFEILTSKECIRQIETISEMNAAFAGEIQLHPNVIEARTLGTVLAIELRSEEETSYSNPLRKRIYSYFLERNILLRPLGNVIYIVPPYVITQTELRMVYATILGFLNALTEAPE